MRRRVRAYSWIIASVTCIVVLFSLGPDPVPDTGSGLLGAVLERLPHAIAYAVLTGFVLLSWTPEERRSIRRLVILAVTLFAIGVVLEVTQRVVGRDAEPMDALANGIGVVVAIGAWAAVARLRGSSSDPARRRATPPSGRRHTGDASSRGADHVLK
jgi:VanZ family protein